jgi:hypothetical protein
LHPGGAQLSGTGRVLLAYRQLFTRKGIMLDTAIKAQWSNYHRMLLLKPARLHFLSCPPTQCAVLLGSSQAMAWGFVEPNDDADDRNQEGAANDPLHMFSPSYL